MKGETVNEVSVESVGDALSKLSPAENLYSREQSAELASSSIAIEENGAEAWRMFKDELDEGGTNYKTSMAYNNAMRTIFQRSMKARDYDSLKKAVEIFGEDVLTEERKQGIANGILENYQLTDKVRSLIEATGIDLKEYHDQGLSEIERMVNNTNLVDRSHGFITVKDVRNWRDLFGITNEEYSETLRQMYFKNPHKYEMSALVELGFVKDGKWTWA